MQSFYAKGAKNLVHFGEGDEIAGGYYELLMAYPLANHKDSKGIPPDVGMTNHSKLLKTGGGGGIPI